MTNYLELIPKPDPSTVNVGLSSPKVSTLRNLLGEPRANYTGDCQPVTGPFKNRIVTKSVGPFRCTGYDVAVAALAEYWPPSNGSFPTSTRSWAKTA